MKIIAKLHPEDEHGCRDVSFDIEHGGWMGDSLRSYSAGKLYLRTGDAEAILRTLGGHSFGFVGEVEVSVQ